MVNEIGRLLAAVVALIAAVLRRTFRGFRFLVRRAAQTRSAAGSAVTGGGRLLDIAALSVAADLLMLAEWWRRSTPPAGMVALAGLLVGVLVSGGAAWLLRGRSVTRFVLAGVEAGRLGCAAVLAFAPPVVVAGGAAGTSSANVAVAGVIALGLLERTLWVVAARLVAPAGHRAATASAAARYVGLLFVPLALAVLLGLALGGLWALLLAQVALLVALITSLALPQVDPPKAALEPVKRPTQPRPPKKPRGSKRSDEARRTDPAQRAEAQRAEAQQTGAQPPAPREAPEPETGEGAYHIYRPSTMDDPPKP